MSFRTIDMTAYPRLEHFRHFITMDHPFISITSDIDITPRFRQVKADGDPLFLSLQYDICHAANRVPAFRQRIRGDGIVEYDQCSASYIILTEDGSYRYCNADTALPFREYTAQARAAEQLAVHDEHLVEDADPDRFYYTSCLPWFSFTALDMPVSNNRFSVPSFTWGRYRTEYVPEPSGDGIVLRETVRLPLTVMVNHALADGSHIAQFFRELDAALREAR